MKILISYVAVFYLIFYLTVFVFVVLLSFLFLYVVMFYDSYDMMYHWQWIGTNALHWYTMHYRAGSVLSTLCPVFSLNIYMYFCYNTILYTLLDRCTGFNVPFSGYHTVIVVLLVFFFVRLFSVINYFFPCLIFIWLCEMKFSSWQQLKRDIVTHW